MDRQPHLFRCPGQHRHALRFIPEPTSGEYHIGLTFNPRRGRCFPAIIHHGWRSDAVYLRRQFGKTPAWSKERGASGIARSEEHTSELQSLMRISYAVFSLKKK